MPLRIRRSEDAIRFGLSLVALAAILLLAVIAKQTTGGLESDITGGAKESPPILLRLADLASGFGVLVVPVAFALDRVLHRDGMRVAIGILAAIVALGVALALDNWIGHTGMRGIAKYVTWPMHHGGWFPGPAHVDITPVIAFFTAVRLAGRTRWQVAAWIMIGLDSIAAVAALNITPVAVFTTYAIGRAVGYATLYAAGSPNTRPDGPTIVTALSRVGLTARRGKRIADGPEETRRYLIELVGTSGDGTGDEATPVVVDVAVLDRDQQATGLLYRLWRRIRLRRGTPRRTVRSLRRSLEQEALMAYAVVAAGAGTPRLLATTEVGIDAALLVYEHIQGRTLAELGDDELTDDLLASIWSQVKLLQGQRLAHRRLVDGSIIVDSVGQTYLTGLRGGEIAATDLALRLDVAQLLTDLALRVGEQRAVRAAAAVLGIDALADCVPLLQKVALARDTGAALRRHPKLLSRLREQIRTLRPEAAAAPVRLNRFRLRTLISIIAGTAAAYILLSQLSHVNLGSLLGSADWVWFGVGILAAAASFTAAAFQLIGFVPEHLSLIRTVAAQLAGSFVKLVAPAAVSGVAINTRFLQKSGLPTTQAAASVGASQLTGMTIHLAMLVTFAYITGSNTSTELPPSRVIIIAVLAIAALATAAAAIGPLRRLIVRRARPLFAGVIPRMLDILQSPKKLAAGVGGTILLTAMFVISLEASILAFGGSVAIATVVVVFLTGNALGSAVPTPGGLGAVEGALTLGLTLAGMKAGVATSAVLLYRLETFWLPVLPGWLAFSWLQRRDAL